MKKLRKFIDGPLDDQWRYCADQPYVNIAIRDDRPVASFTSTHDDASMPITVVPYDIAVYELVDWLPYAPSDACRQKAYRFKRIERSS